jgi:hypothetical protein
MLIEDFIKRECYLHKGKIPQANGDFLELKARWENLGESFSRRMPVVGLIHLLQEETGDAATKLLDGALRYADLSRLAHRYGEVDGFLDERLDEDLRATILALHDHYVIMRNGEARELHPNSTSQNGNACKQCGECCIGPAMGPISTSPLDLELWRDLDRDDLLHYTLVDTNRVEESIRSLAFECCPFLRFTRAEQGFCLVHPVKPRICVEFTCEH